MDYGRSGYLVTEAARLLERLKDLDAEKAETGAKYEDVLKRLLAEASSALSILTDAGSNASASTSGDSGSPARGSKKRSRTGMSEGAIRTGSKGRRIVEALCEFPGGRAPRNTLIGQLARQDGQDPAGDYLKKAYAGIYYLMQRECVDHHDDGSVSISDFALDVLGKRREECGQQAEEQPENEGPTNALPLVGPSMSHGPVAQVEGAPDC